MTNKTFSFKQWKALEQFFINLGVGYKIKKGLKSSRRELVRNCILELLSEWYFSFGPELGTFRARNEKDLENFVRMNIKQFITETKWSDSDRNMKLISDFNDYFDEEAST